MSSPAFAILLALHPEQRPLAERFEAALLRAIRRDHQGVLDEDHLASTSHLTPDVVRGFLADLLKSGLICYRLAWTCPRGDGVIAECDHLRDFELVTDCPQCGGIHELDADDIEVFFLPTARFLGDPSVEADYTGG